MYQIPSQHELEYQRLCIRLIPFRQSTGSSRIALENMVMKVGSHSVVIDYGQISQTCRASPVYLFASSTQSETKTWPVTEVLTSVVNEKADVSIQQRKYSGKQH